MKTNATSDNGIFINALMGSLLFILSIIFTVSNLSNIAMLKMSYTGIAFVLGVASVSLLYKAIKKDKERTRQMI